MVILDPLEGGQHDGVHGIREQFVSVGVGCVYARSLAQVGHFYFGADTKELPAEIGLVEPITLSYRIHVAMRKFVGNDWLHFN